MVTRQTYARSLIHSENNKRALSLRDNRIKWHRICKRSHWLNSRNRWTSAKNFNRRKYPAASRTIQMVQIRCNSRWMWGNRPIMPCLALVHLVQQSLVHFTFKHANTQIPFLTARQDRIRASLTLRRSIQQLLETIIRIIARYRPWPTICNRISIINTRWHRICDRLQWWTIQWQATCSTCKVRITRCNHKSRIRSTNTC